MTNRVRALLILVAISITVAAVWAARGQRNAQQRQLQLASYLPPNALLTLESPDFSKLIADWNSSPEQQAWLSSANYSAFANSHLFGRLQAAQNEFAGASSAAVNVEFLRQIAGTRSIFAWYDIAQLQFVYITRMRLGQADTIDLLRQRGKFQQRQVGSVQFYVRTGTATGEDGQANGDDGQPTGQPRTVAFAVSGDWLVLATREDLLVNTLGLMQRDPARPSDTISMADTDWYSHVNDLTGPNRGELHMVIDLKSVVRTPYFRTYWIQRNITATAQYRAATADLFREGNVFREERVLIPLDTAPIATNAQVVADIQAWVPDRVGVYRATAAPSAQAAWQAIQEKPLALATAAVGTARTAPAVDLSRTQPGSASDLESTIDKPPVSATANQAGPLQDLLRTTTIAGMLTVDRTVPPQPPSLFVPIQSAVVLQAAAPWNAEALRVALAATANEQLTTSDMGTEWKSIAAPGATYFAMVDARPLALYISGNLAIIASSPALLNDMLSHHLAATPAAPAAVLAAGFNHTQERAGYKQLVTALDHGTAQPAQSPQTSAANPFFSSEMRSLSEAFAALDTERLVERHDTRTIRQTVTYTFRR